MNTEKKCQICGHKLEPEDTEREACGSCYAMEVSPESILGE